MTGSIGPVHPLHDRAIAGSNPVDKRWPRRGAWRVRPNSRASDRGKCANE